MGSAHVAEYEAHFSITNPRLQIAAPMAAGQLYLDAEHLNESAIDRSAYFAWLDRALGLRHCAAASLIKSEELWLAICFNRGSREAAFSDEDAGFLRRLAPHLTAAAGLAVRMELFERMQTACVTGLELVKAAVGLLDGRGRLLHANRALDELLAEKDGLQLVDKRLTAQRATDARNLDRLLATCLDQGEFGVNAEEFSLIFRSSGRRPYLARATPVPPGNSVFAPIQPSVVITIVDPDAILSRNIEFLRRLFELAPVELRLAEQLASGLSLQECAQARGITEGTARQQLKSLFRKTGTHTQAQLVRLILQVTGQ